MAVITPPLTYERYLEEGEVFRRYDIVDGERIFMTNPTRRHQRILLNIAKLLSRYEETYASGQVLLAPCDVLIRRHPLRTRQPDVLFISHAQLAKCGDASDPAPLEAAPELVIEILSPSDTRRAREGKIEDYGSIGVKECWVVSPEAETVEVLQFTSAGAETSAVYAGRQTLRSLCLPDLAIAVGDVFAA